MPITPEPGVRGRVNNVAERISPEYIVSETDGVLTTTPANLLGWYEHVKSRQHLREDRYRGNEQLSHEMFSLVFYHWMLEAEKLNEAELTQRITIDGETYLAERVFEIPYTELNLRFDENDIYGQDFGEKGILRVCRDAVDLRAQNRQATLRVLHDGLGMWNLHGLLGRMKVGETAVLLSLPDPDDPNMGDYSFVYLYEKVSDTEVRMGIIRREEVDGEFWKREINDASKAGIRFDGFDHLKFVARPFIGKGNFSELKKNLLTGESGKEIPYWATAELQNIVPHVVKAISENNVERAEKLFNAFKIGVTSRLLDQGKEVDAIRMVDDWLYFAGITRWYLDNGGKQFLSYESGCALDTINLADRDLFANQRLDFSRNQFGNFSETKGESNSSSIDTEKVALLDSGAVPLSKIISDGEEQCYRCPVCSGDSKGQVYKYSHYLICTQDPKEHILNLN